MTVDNEILGKLDKGLEENDGCSMMDYLKSMPFSEQRSIFEELKAKHQSDNGKLSFWQTDSPSGQPGFEFKTDNKSLFFSRNSEASGNQYLECKSFVGSKLTKQGGVFQSDHQK